MPSKLLTIEQVLTLLTETPSRIAALTAGLAAAQLHAAPNPGEWSLNDVWPICVRAVTCGATTS